MADRMVIVVRIEMNRLMSLIGAAAGFALVASPALAGAAVVPVPEPTSMALLVAGIGGVAVAKFRRRK